jgi:hypothetical protein
MSLVHPITNANIDTDAYPMQDSRDASSVANLTFEVFKEDGEIKYRAVGWPKVSRVPHSTDGIGSCYLR